MANVTWSKLAKQRGFSMQFLHGKHLVCDKTLPTSYRESMFLSQIGVLAGVSGWIVPARAVHFAGSISVSACCKTTLIALSCRSGDSRTSFGSLEQDMEPNARHLVLPCALAQ